MTKSKLYLTIDFINSQNDTFRPKNLREYAKLNEFYSNSVEQYLGQLHKANFIKRLSFGVYTKINTIPFDLTTTTLYKMAYDDNYRRLLKIQKLLNDDK